MTTLFAPASPVEGITRTPVPYGLFSVLTPRPEGDGRWQNGIRWEPLTCSAASGLGPDCDAEAAIGFPKGFPVGAGIGDAEPFAVYGAYRCSPIGHDLTWAQERAMMHLIAREESAAENALWTGALGNLPVIAAGADELNGGVAADPVDAVGLLEDWLADNYGSLGVIHMTRRAAVSAVASLAVQREGNRLVTAVGTPVVAGQGYPGTSPSGAAPAAGESWMYATPALLGYRSDIISPTNRPGDLLDRGTNDMHGMAERMYLIGFDPCGTAGVEVTLGCC